MFSSKSDSDQTKFGSLAYKLTPTRIGQKSTKAVFHTKKYSKITLEQFSDSDPPEDSLPGPVCTAMLGGCRCGHCQDDSTGLSWG